MTTSSQRTDQSQCDNTGTDIVVDDSTQTQQDQQNPQTTDSQQQTDNQQTSPSGSNDNPSGSNDNRQTINNPQNTNTDNNNTTPNSGSNSPIGTTQPLPHFTVYDQTTATYSSTQGDVYPTDGPVSGLNWQVIEISQDTLITIANTPNVFIHGGAGDDAIAALSGRNVLDGGTGSNWLVGGSGQDTFFIDDRNPTHDVWSTIGNAGSGDDITVFGITATNANVAWSNSDGSASGLGLTAHVTAAGKPTASLTLAGYSTADLANGRLNVSYGANGAEPYMHIQVT